MKLPEDPMMLYSFINMKLRDFYPSLDALCEDMNVEKEVIVRTLKRVGFEYNPERNRFWCRKLINRWVGAVSCKDAAPTFFVNKRQIRSVSFNFFPFLLSNQ